MIKKNILEAENMLIMRVGDDPKENLRTAYETALIADGKQIGFSEPEKEMFSRTGKFIFDYIDALNEILAEIFEDVGLTGGVVPGKINDIDTQEALQVFNINFALLEAETFKDHLLNEISKWLGKETENGNV